MPQQDIVTDEAAVSTGDGDEVEWQLPEENELPNEWTLVQLRNICRSKFRSINPQDFPDEVFEYYSIPAFQDSGAPAFESGQRILSNKLLVERGTVLFGKLNPRVLKVWMVNSTGTQRTIASTEFLPVFANAKAEPEFLYYICQSGFVVREATRLVTGSTPSRQRVDPTSFYNIGIPLPSLPEQRAIAHVLRTVQDAIAARRREVEMERERKAALMQHLFMFGTGESYMPVQETQFGWVPAHWRVAPLETCATVQTGVAKGRKLGDVPTVSLPYLRVANVQDGYLDLSEIKHIELRQMEVKQYSLQPGDVVVTEGGDFDKLGRGFLWRGEIPTCVHQNHIFAVRAHRQVLEPEYLAYLIQSDYGKAYFLSVAHRTTNLASINSTKLKAFPALVPSLEEQRSIAAMLSTCDVKIDALEREQALLDELFRALLEELMTGQLSALPLIEDATEHASEEAEALA